MTDQINLTNDLYTENINHALTTTAPPCPECGAALTATNLQRHTNYDNDDRVTYALETYRCPNRHWILRRLELDRETKAERDEQRELAVKRAEAMYRIPFLASLTRRGWLAYRREVERQYPPRPDVDLMARYIKAREGG